MIRTIESMTQGESGIVKGFAKGSGSYKQKLLAMGLTPGVSFKVQRVAPLGDPVDIKVRGSHLSLRKVEASIVTIEITEENIL